MDIFIILLNLVIGAIFIIGAYLQLQSDLQIFAKNEKVCLGTDFKLLALGLLLVSLVSYYFWQILLLPIFLGTIVILIPKISMPIKEAVQWASLGFSTTLVLGKLSNGVHLPWTIVIAVALAPTIALTIFKLVFLFKGEK